MELSSFTALWLSDVSNLLMMSMVLSASSMFWLLATAVLAGTFFFQFSSPFFCRAASLNERGES